jgi:hypothetical protein
VGGDFELEPLVKGEKLKTVIGKMFTLMGDLSGCIADINLSLVKLGGSYSGHTHIGNYGGPTPVDPGAIQAGIELILKQTDGVANKIVTFQQNWATAKLDAIMPFGGNYICSKWHHAN